MAPDKTLAQTPAPDWTRHPRAQQLLASCAVNPPRCVCHVQHFTITTDEWTTWTGARVDELNRLYAAAFDDAEAAGQAGDFLDQPGVQEAISRAFDPEWWAARDAMLAPVTSLSRPIAAGWCWRERLH